MSEFDVPRIGGGEDILERLEHIPSAAGEPSREAALHRSEHDDYYDEEYRRRIHDIDEKFNKEVNEIKKRYDDEMRRIVEEQREKRRSRVSAARAPYKILEESEEVLRTDSSTGKRHLIKRNIETFSDRSQRVTEKVYDESQQNIIDEKSYCLDARGNRIEGKCEHTSLEGATGAQREEERRMESENVSAQAAAAAGDVSGMRRAAQQGKDVIIQEEKV